jgi:DNA modification methylase
MLSLSHIAQETNGRPKRTLENRLNNLSWRDWLLFQKSFFMVSNDRTLFSGLIEFFSKAHRPDSSPSRVLALGIDRELSLDSMAGRMLTIETLNSSRLSDWPVEDDKHAYFDLLLIDMREMAILGQSTDLVLRSALLGFYAKCRSILRPGCFCAVLSYETESSDEQNSYRFPLPWILASLARSSFRLRDEKIGIEVIPTKNILHVNILQALDEIGPGIPSVEALNIATGSTATQERWIVPRPKPRRKNEILHPAKFPEDLVERLLTEFSNPGDTILDPMGGTGSVAIASLQLDRIPVLVELDKSWTRIACERIETLVQPSLFKSAAKQWAVIPGDARDVGNLIPEKFRPICYSITSPPYWRILHNPGMHEKDEGQKARQAKGLATTYSASIQDLGNTKDYAQFINELASIYESVAKIMHPGSILTVITKNVKFERANYTIAWDLVFRLCRRQNGYFEYAGTTFWCQDDIRLKPFGMGCDWISNVLHHYCIHLRVRQDRILE